MAESWQVVTEGNDVALQSDASASRATSARGCGRKASLGHHDPSSGETSLNRRRKGAHVYEITHT